MSFKFPTFEQVDQLYSKFTTGPPGWRVAMRARFGYFKPIAWYQAVISQLVGDQTKWIDIGGGKSIFRHNHDLSRELADRAALLVGVDPSDTLDQNELVHEKSKSTLENYKTDHVFDLATMRMVAEHVENPNSFVETLSRLVGESGFVVILTPNKWAIASLVAAVVPDRFHPAFARILSPKRLDEDVFPTVYRMNTRKDLRRVFSDNGFDEVCYSCAADCVLLQRFRFTYFFELLTWKVFSLLGIRYPENNILAIYQRRR